MTEGTPAEKLKERLRRDLTAALKEKRRDEATALRILIGAVDNAESLEVRGGAALPESSEHIAGAVAGLGAGEAARHALSQSELQRIIKAEVAELREQADRFEAHGRADAAARIRGEAEVIKRYRRKDR
jgi:hypothetical protein